MFYIAAIFEGKRQISDFRRVFAQLQTQVPDIAMDVFDTGDIDGDDACLQECLECVKSCDFVFFNFHGSMAYFKRYLSFQPYFEGVKPYFFRSSIDSEMEEMTRRCKLPAPTVTALLTYLEAGGEKNMTQFLRRLLHDVAGFPLDWEPVEWPVLDGFYGKPEGMSDEDYLRQIRQTGKPVIGVIIHLSSIRTGNLAHIDCMVDEIRKADCIPLCMFSNVIPSSNKSCGGLRAALRRYMMLDGESVPQAVIVTTGHALSVLSAPGCGMEQVSDSVFEILGVPALHALTTNYSVEKWKESIRGMDPVYLGNVFTAEYDGQLLGAIAACTEQVETGYGIKEQYVPLPDRIHKLVHLAKNWALLSLLPPGQKKIAIILHNMPPRVDMIGCAYGLDTPQSVYNIVEVLRRLGVPMDYSFESGKQIIDRITAGLTNDGRFSSAQELLEKAEAVVEPEVWQKWVADFPEKVKQELLRDWGPAPGEFMAIDGKILIPGIKNGNVFIGLQPPRAKEEKAEKAYHSTNLVCTYQYIAYYRYIEHIFGANAIVHVGTHGTLEWLPGKEIGLSAACYPELTIGYVPNIYPYIIDVPGEGAQAKRRSSACIIDHLIPSMTESGTYGDISVIDDLLAKYNHAKLNENAKTGTLQEQIRELSDKLHLTEDLRLTEEDFRERFEATAEKLHLWVSDIKVSEIRDGLHIFGQAPRQERMRNMLRLLVRVRNGSVPSLREGMAAFFDWDLDELLDNSQTLHVDGETNAARLERLDELGRELFRQWEEADYAASTIGELLLRFTRQQGLDMTKSTKLERCLRFTAEEVYPRLLATAEELSSFETAFSGKFVRKGSSGAPSRGNAMILPTGRNFYTIDPTEIPSRASWETGKQLSKQLLAAHQAETGKLPEEVAIVVYSGETMKTGGDDVAETLFLYGITPVWLGETDKVIGLRVIPLEELGRPRIDVTLRITGLFRDTFPNLIELVDEAVNMAASLDESHEQNFIRKHVDEDMREFMASGMEREQAYERAALRIYGCPPGTYGAGVAELVNNKKWENSDDLGNAYITWSGHGYSRKRHGDKLQDLFARRLSHCDATVKNISSCEADMLDSDDFFNYHGGLISAVKAVRGKAPESYSTNSADTGHVVTRTIQQETARIMRARINNPKWIEGMKQHGFKGAQEFSAMVDIVFGWDATSDVVEDYMYDSLYETYLHNKELRDWIWQENPWALHAMSERLLEAAQRGMWAASEDKLAFLQEIYLEMEGDFEGGAQ